MMQLLLLPGPFSGERWMICPQQSSPSLTDAKTIALASSTAREYNRPVFFLIAIRKYGASFSKCVLVVFSRQKAFVSQSIGYGMLPEHANLNFRVAVERAFE
jgi:hypothetical protein